MTVSLNSMRDLLLPATWGLAGKHNRNDVDLVIDYESDAIDVVVDGVATRVLTRREIEDRSYVKDFSSRIETALKEREAK